MASHTDNAIEGTEQDMRGQTRGPRAKYFMCLNWKLKVFEVFEAATPEDASKAFEAKHSQAPNLVESGKSIEGGGAGFYLVKGTGMGDAQRVSVTVSAEQMTRFTTTHVKAHYRGWVVYGNGLKACKSNGMDFKDDELFSIQFANLIDKDDKQPKPKLKKTEAVRREDLEIKSQST